MIKIMIIVVVKKKNIFVCRSLAAIKNFSIQLSIFLYLILMCLILLFALNVTNIWSHKKSCFPVFSASAAS